jgi:hypothetical protein
MEEHLYRIDAALAAIADCEVEARLRQALETGEQVLVIVLARQLALRVLPVIERTCWLHAEEAGIERSECERVIEEALIKLLLRLLHDRSWRSLPGLASAITRSCLEESRRQTARAGFRLRPRLRLVAVAGVPHSRRQGNGGGDNHESR